MEGWKLKGTCTGDTCIHRKTEKYWFYINGEQKIEKNGRRNLRFYSWWEYNFLQTSGCNMFPKNFCTVQRGNRGSPLFLHPQWICYFHSFMIMNSTSFSLKENSFKVYWSMLRRLLFTTSEEEIEQKYQLLVNSSFLVTVLSQYVVKSYIKLFLLVWTHISRVIFRR